MAKELELSHCNHCNIKVAEDDSNCVICGNELCPYSVESMTKGNRDEKGKEEE